MSYGISREEGLELVRAYLKNDNLVNHCLAAEAVLRAMAKHLGEDQEKWGLAGLLHDLDSETQPDLATHTSETVAILTEKGVDPEIVEAIKLHNPTAWPGEQRTTVFHHALAAGETITGLIIASALVNPARKLGCGQGQIGEENAIKKRPLPGGPTGRSLLNVNRPAFRWPIFVR